MTKAKNILLILMLLPIGVAAQVKFGYLSHHAICQEMPQYAKAQMELQQLKQVYDQEAKRGEEEFQRKFADFLHGQKEFPANILHKRQSELQDLMDKGIKFRREAEELLEEAEQTFLKDLKKQLNAAIVAVGVEMGYAFILNTDDDACPFINPLLGEDVSNAVRDKLGIPILVPQFTEEGTTVEPTQTDIPAPVAPVDSTATGNEASETDNEPSAQHESDVQETPVETGHVEAERPE